MLPCHSCYISVTWRSKDIGGFKVIVWREAEVGKPQSQGGGGGCFWGSRPLASGILTELTTYFSLF